MMSATWQPALCGTSAVFWWQYLYGTGHDMGTGTCTGRGSDNTTGKGTYPLLCTHTAGLLDEGCDEPTHSQNQGSELSGLAGTVVPLRSY